MKKNNLDKLMLFSSSLIQTDGVLNQYFRIPDVLARIVKAKVTLQKNKLPVPLWMYGLSDKKENNPVKWRLASFLVTLGLYDRFVRSYSVPDFLVGSSLAVSVAARMKTFERSIFKILMGGQYHSQAIRVYRKRADQTLRGLHRSARFSLLSFSKSANYKLILQSLKQECSAKKGVLISVNPSKMGDLSLPLELNHFSFENFIHMDSQLEWLGPILHRNQIRRKNTHSQFIEPLIEDSFI